MKRLGPFFRLAPVALALALGACAGYDTRLNNRDIKYLGTGGPVIDPAMKEVSPSKSPIGMTRALAAPL